MRSSPGSPSSTSASRISAACCAPPSAMPIASAARSLRFFDDGRLALTDDAAEPQLRRVAVGRKSWLFAGSDDRAQAAGNLLTLVASARFHRSTPRPTSATSSGSCPIGHAIATSSSPRATGSRPAPVSMPPSSSATWAHSSSPARPRRSSRPRVERIASVTPPSCHQPRSLESRGSCSAYSFSTKPRRLVVEARMGGAQPGDREDGRAQHRRGQAEDRLDRQAHAPGHPRAIVWPRLAAWDS
jgi:hypothetical protein